jgi:hypothetical protein
MIAQNTDDLSREIDEEKTQSQCNFRALAKI